jgi:SAM-dependent methyltransferase
MLEEGRGESVASCARLNDFLRSVAAQIPAGRVLMLAEGEGRNAVYLAEQGYEVTAVDSSSVGLQKAMQLAAERNVGLTTIRADLGDFTIEAEAWEGIISCFCHLHITLRVPLHQAVVRGLKPGGMFVFEGFSKEQLSYGTGGPQSLDLLMSLDELKQELAGLEFVHAVQVERKVHEGRGHTGLASVVQIWGVKA